MWPAPRAAAGTVLGAFGLWASAGCARRVDALANDPRAAAITTADPTASMIYVARTDAGVVVIDLGWWRGVPALQQALAAVQATPSAVTDVFLTHSHRDHTAAWRSVRHARFHVAEREVAPLLGAASHQAPLVRWTDRLLPPRLPRRGELALRPFASDTAFVFGADTLRAFLAPGHTAGSAAYLFRGVLFVGDAVTHGHGRGFAAAKPRFTDDRRVARQSVAALWTRLAPYRVRMLCTAHARCAPPTAAVRRETLR